MADNTEIQRRRTFAIIAHPDAGKTSLTEKLLLFGGQIQVAGAVKSNKIKKTATSDWMEIEKQRGISVTTSVMEFDYRDYKINILDTPGHQDFAEDTYRTLTAVDSVIIVVDGAKGVETQTRKLMEVCRMRKTPVIIFVNKMDREGKDPFDLLDELEEELMIQVRPLSWPIEQGARFKGVYNIYEQKLDLYQPSKQMVTEKVEVDIHTEELDQQIGKPLADKLRGDLELIEGVYPELDVESYLAGDCAPVFFGSALNNFGVQELLNCFVEIAPSPRPVQAEEREVKPDEPKFTGFIFKITANIDPNHRSCVAFCKICSGKFVRRLKSDGRIVSNCHKLPEKMFDRQRLSTQEIVEDWKPLLLALWEQNPALKILFTVSPIRHWKDGAHENQLSKATLLLATDALQKDYPGRIAYFPAYEILMDELRDYRFYADDMLHPSPLAIDYIWQRFIENFLSTDTSAILKEWGDIQKAINHKPFQPDSEAYKRFILQTLLKMERISEKIPSFDIRKEIEIVKSKLK